MSRLPAPLQRPTIRNQGGPIARAIRIMSADCAIEPNATQREIFPGHPTVVSVKPMPPLYMPAGPRTCTFRVETDGPEADDRNNEFRYSWIVMP